jgi:hypothetical protein
MESGGMPTLIDRPVEGVKPLDGEEAKKKSFSLYENELNDFEFFLASGNTILIICRS